MACRLCERSEPAAVPTRQPRRHLVAELGERPSSVSQAPEHTSSATVFARSLRNTITEPASVRLFTEQRTVRPPRKSDRRVHGASVDGHGDDVPTIRALLAAPLYRFLPSSRCVGCFSTRTMASSTTSPIASTIASTSAVEAEAHASIQRSDADHRTSGMVTTGRMTY